MFVILKLPPHKCFWIFSQFPLSSWVTSVLCSGKCLFFNLEQQASWGLSQHIMTWAVRRRLPFFEFNTYTDVLPPGNSLYLLSITPSPIYCWLTDTVEQFSPLDLQQLLYMRLKCLCDKTCIFQLTRYENPAPGTLGVARCRCVAIGQIFSSCLQILSRLAAEILLIF